MKWLLLLTGVLVSGCMAQPAAENSTTRLKALIVDGQNNHLDWPKTTMMMKQYLEQTGLFSVDIVRTATTWKGNKRSAAFPLSQGVVRPDLPKPEADPNFKPDFAQYDLVVSNFGWRAAPWPHDTQRAFEVFIENGGGLVIVHAANNSWPKWKAFNQMIGLGGWGGRDEKDGPYVYYTDQGQLIRDHSPGHCGSHGPQHNFVIELRNPDHPVVQGMPNKWLHAKDELYAHLRGPAENMTILASAYSKKEPKGTGRHEPVLMALDYGKGRIFHTTLGHAAYSMEGVGFIVSFNRGAEWAATGAVTQVIPNDFPQVNQSQSRPFTWNK